MLAIIPVELYNFCPVIFPMELFQDYLRGIGTPIVYVNDFKSLPQGIENLFEPGMQFGQAFFFIQNRYQNG